MAVTPPTQAAAPVRMRTSDAQRKRVVASLESAVAAGALTPAEGEERIAAVRAAVFADELAAPVADLPGRSGRGPATSGSVRGAALALFAALAAFVGRHRVWSFVLVVLVVAGIVALGVLAGHGHGGPGGFGGHGGHRGGRG